MPIPNLTALGELPAGIHIATMREVEAQFGSQNDRRKYLMNGLRQAGAMFQNAGVKYIILDGSFVTDKEEPGDVDGCWSTEGLTDESLQRIDEVFLDFNDPVAAKRVEKNRYGTDFYIAEWIEGGSGKPFPEFFQTNRNGDPKGVLKVTLN